LECSGERCRRCWIEEKRPIVAESPETWIRPVDVIRKHGITPGQFYAWRQQPARRVDWQPRGGATSFARVEFGGGRRTGKHPVSPCYESSHLPREPH
jgi:transposase-like protein